MSKEVATQSRTELAQESAVDPFASAAGDMAGSSAQYAKFNGNSGEFTYGSVGEEIEKGERMAANVMGARKGWICWVDSEVEEEIMVPVAEGKPPRSDQLKDHGPYTKYDDGTEDGWSEQFAIDFRLLGEDHDGVEITYKTGTKSAMRPLGDLLKEFSKQYKNNPGKVPIVEFGKGDYMPKEKKHGKKYFPTFKIVEWMDEDELLEQYGSDSTIDEGEQNDNLIDQDEAEEAPKKETKSKKAAKAQAKPEPETSEEPEEDDEIAAMEAEIARKKAEKAAAKKSESSDDKPAPKAGRGARRRSF